jgi:hypothetical protein
MADRNGRGEGRRRGGRGEAGGRGMEDESEEDRGQEDLARDRREIQVNDILSGPTVERDKRLPS